MKKSALTERSYYEDIMKRVQVVQVIFAGVRAVCPAAEPNGYNNGYNFFECKEKTLDTFHQVLYDVQGDEHG